MCAVAPALRPHTDVKRVFFWFRLASLELASAMRTVVDRVHPIVVTVRHAANVVLGTLLEAGVRFEAAAASRFGVAKLAQKVLQETTTIEDRHAGRRAGYVACCRCLGGPCWPDAWLCWTH
jgi:hypothetical protein